MDKSTLETMTDEALQASLEYLEQEAKALDADPRAWWSPPAKSADDLTEEDARRSLVPIKSGDEFVYKPLADCVWSDLSQIQEFQERHLQAHQAVKEAVEVLMLRATVHGNA